MGSTTRTKRQKIYWITARVCVFVCARCTKQLCCLQSKPLTSNKEAYDMSFFSLLSPVCVCVCEWYSVCSPARLVWFAPFKKVDLLCIEIKENQQQQQKNCSVHKVDYIKWQQQRPSKINSNNKWNGLKCKPLFVCVCVFLCCSVSFSSAYNVYWFFVCY